MRSKKAWQSKNWVSWNSCRGKDGDIASKIISPRYSSPRADLETQNKRVVLPLMFFILASFLLSTNEKIYLQGQRHSPQTLLTALQYLELQFYNEHSIPLRGIPSLMRNWEHILCFPRVRTRRDSSNRRCCAAVSGCYSLCRKSSLYIHPA